MRALNFLFEIARLRTHSAIPTSEVASLLHHYPEWSESLTSGLTPIEMGTPWMVYGSRDFLRDYLRPGDRVFEYSTGGSTVFLAGLGLRGFSVEHDAAWANLVRQAITRFSQEADWEIRVVPPNPTSADPEKRFRSQSPRYREASFVDYVQALSEFPRDYFTLIIVDGRARVACIDMASNYVTPGGYILVDNSDRDEYRGAVDRLQQCGWQTKEFHGPVPTGAAFSCTTLLRRPAS